MVKRYSVYNITSTQTKLKQRNMQYIVQISDSWEACSAARALRSATGVPSWAALVARGRRNVGRASARLRYCIARTFCTAVYPYYSPNVWLQLLAKRAIVLYQQARNDLTNDGNFTNISGVKKAPMSGEFTVK